MSRSRGVPDEELFISRPRPSDEDCDSPTVEPLRIFKPMSPKPPGAADKASYKYPAPPTSSAQSSASASASKPSIAPLPGLPGLPPLPSFPLPPGASSSAAPLPYPDDDLSRPTQASKPARAPYPVDDVRRPSPASSTGRIYSPPPTSSSPQLHNDTTPRLNISPVDKKPGLADRRGAVPKPLQSPDSPNGDDLFAKPLGRPQPAQPAQPVHPAQRISNAYQQKPYYPPPGGSNVRKNSESSIARISSTASTSTTRASRGSPPPPETPIVEPGVIPGGGIEARYAAAGISGTATLTSLQAQTAQSAAAQSRLAQYGGQRPPSQPQHSQHPALAQQQPQAQAQPPRPWTPTESPDQQPFGPPTVYQGDAVAQNPQPARPQPQQQNSFNLPKNPEPASNAPAGSSLQVSVLEQDFQRMQASTPPPAYSSVTPNASSAYPAEKQRPTQAHPATANNNNATPNPTSRPATAASGSTRPVNTASPAPSSSIHKPKPVAVAAPQTPAQQHPGHPAFANEPQQHPAQAAHNVGHPALQHTPSLMASTQAPPPLPEGWIAHLDQNSGQYYYIHLATQATQWEFPKGPNPINHEAAPLSPTASTYGNPLASPLLGGKAGLASPMFHPQTPGYAESIMTVASAAPSGFTGPPPSAGVDMYKIMPTNGVYFGPYLRYVNMDLEKGIWHGSIMIVTDAPQPPTIHIHLSVDLSPNPRQLIPHNIWTHQRWVFYKYDMDLQMSEHGTERWTYAVTSHLGCTRYEFIVAGRYETGWRMIAHSGNDFAPSTNQSERAKLGGVGFMWKDILQKNVECGGFHVQLGLGDQIYGDRLWREVPILKQWLSIAGRENRKNVAWTARHEEDVTHAYFHYYTSHFDQPFMREAFAQIPHVLQIDDHDIFDGFGSYPEYMQSSAIFKNIGRIAIDMYLLFQHHTTVEMLRNVSSDMDLFTITGAGWHFVKYLGPAVVVVGPDCRSERTQTRVMAGPTYQGLFPKVAMLPPSVQHCIWMLSVPVVYPRLETVETLANTFATGKKAVNTTYNLLGKVTSSVAGVVGGKEVVAHGFKEVKRAVGKSGLMGNVLNQFGEFEVAEELKDLWTHESKDLERTYLIRTLQGIAQQKGIRMTFLSGDVTTAGAGLLHDPSHPSDHKTMYQLITSPIVAAPCSSYLLKALHSGSNSNKLLYVPLNGHKSTHEVSDTKEDMMEIFHTDASGAAREYKKLMARRNYVAIVAYDPDAVAAGGGMMGQMGGMGGMGTMGGPGAGYAASVHSGGSGGGLNKLSLAVDFVVQGDGAFTATTKYGPVIVPHLEYGH